MDTEFYKNVLSDLSDAIKYTKCSIYIFGGFTIDIWKNDILRDHHDVDTICIDFWMNSKSISAFFETRGYNIVKVPNGDLKIKKNDFGISMTNCELQNTFAKWSPYGVKGGIYFPVEWLDNKPYFFRNDFPLYTVDRKFEFCLKSNPQYFNPDWPVRDHSKTLSYLTEYFSTQEISPESFIKSMYPKSENEQD